MEESGTATVISKTVTFKTASAFVLHQAMEEEDDSPGDCSTGIHFTAFDFISNSYHAHFPPLVSFPSNLDALAVDNFPVPDFTKYYNVYFHAFKINLQHAFNAMIRYQHGFHLDFWRQWTEAFWFNKIPLSLIIWDSICHPLWFFSPLYLE